MVGFTCKRVFLFIFFVIGVAGLIVALLFHYNSDDTDPEVEPKAQTRPLWGWRCEDSRCIKFKLTPENNATAVGLDLCRFQCHAETIGTLWPKPTRALISKEVTNINVNEILFKTSNFANSVYWEMARERFIDLLMRKNSLTSGGRTLAVEIIAESNDMNFDYDTDESYKLSIAKTASEIVVVIEANNFYGVRHGLETLSQLIIYDNIQQARLITTSAEIDDKPQFKHRGISLDTSRNFFPVDAIKRQLNGMAMTKLNTFHWHISDSQSFPLYLKSHPELAEFSSYSLDEIYTPEDVIEIVKFAKARGIRVIPEIDIPGHVGEGWYMKNLTSCYSAQPWEICKGARPCGQLDPSKDEVYQVLEEIFREIVPYFDDPNVIHMGADEVFIECWNASSSLQTWMKSKDWNLETDDFMKLWGYFQEHALQSIDNARSKKVPVIIWSSSLTFEPYLTELLDKNRYIVQVWAEGKSKEFQTILENGYRVIMSNSDALYLDCGFGSWVRDGNNWCSPYKPWQTFYDNSIETIAGDYVEQVLGAEAALWTEQVDEWSLDARIWPRASALAERLWSNPETGFRQAESRMLMHRSQLVEIGGLGAEQLQPIWCLQNEGSCPL